MEKVNIKKADISNINNMLEIFLTIHNQNFENKKEEKYFLDIFSNNQYEVYTLNITENKSKKIEKKIIGYIIFYDTIDSVDLFEIAINKQFQKKGFGNTLLNESIKLLFNDTKYINRGNENKTILLEVNEKNIKAINLYKKNDFEQISIRKNYYENNENAIIMIKKCENM